ncbi:hypothetical protein JW964_05350, partial [candidate division KSB1 bacterium]|nr:hypothetical protein [candidate division KSB1 bacterium]
MLIKKNLLIFLSFFSFNTLAYGQSLSIESYYPIPFGTYDHIRLYPKAFNTSQSCQEGILRADEVGTLFYC